MQIQAMIQVEMRIQATIQQAQAVMSPVADAKTHPEMMQDPPEILPEIQTVIRTETTF
jgi:hypothetical protein